MLRPATESVFVRLLGDLVADSDSYIAVWIAGLLLLDQQLSRGSNTADRLKSKVRRIPQVGIKRLREEGGLPVEGFQESSDSRLDGSHQVGSGSLPWNRVRLPLGNFQGTRIGDAKSDRGQRRQSDAAF